MTEEAPNPARELVNSHMQHVIGTQHGFLARLRRESGVAVIAGIVLSVLSVVAVVAAGGAEGGPLIAALVLVPALPIVMCALWLDRNEPEPAWLLVRTFIWGACIATLIAGLFNAVVGVTAGTQIMVVAGAPIIEEACKGIALVWVLRRFDEHINSRLDATIYAIAVGLGFAVVENTEYYLGAWKDGGLSELAGTALLRGVATPFLHPVFTMMTAWGIVAGMRLAGGARVRRIALGYGAAVSLHALWNSGIGLILYAPVGIPLFVWLAVRTKRASNAEAAQLHEALAQAYGADGPATDASTPVGVGSRVRVRDLFGAARDPHHPYHAQWQTRHLAWIVASEHTAAQVALDDPAGLITAPQVQAAARELLAERMRATGPNASRVSLLSSVEQQ